MATESNRDKARRGGWGTGEVLSVGAVAVDRASGPDFTGRTVHVAGAPSCNQTLTIDVDGQHIAVPLSASNTAAVAAGKIAAALGPRYEARGSTVVERPVPNASRPTDRLAGIRAAFAPGPPARVGFTCPPLGLGESAILRLDNTGPEPVAGMSRDGGQTWEDAPRWPAPLDVLPGVVVMSAWRRPDGALVAEGSDGVDRVTKPGEIRTPEDADRLFGVGFGLGRWMRENAGAAVFRIDDLTPGANGPVQPAPAPGQVWLPPVGAVPPHWRAADGTVTIAATPASDRYVTIEGAPAGHEWRAFVPNIAAEGWTCIGVATPHGRVMVGDAFCPDADAPEWTVSAVGYPPGTVVLSRPDAGSCSNDAAHVAARWQRTRYAPARAGERYGWRATGDVETVETAPDGTLQTRSGYGARPMRGLRGVTPDTPSFNPAQWERLDPAQAEPRDGQIIRIKRPASVVEAEHARTTGAAEAESDAALRARCRVFDRQRHPQWRAPNLDIASGMGIKRRAAAEPAITGHDGAPATLTLAAPARDLRAIFDAIGRALESAAPEIVTFGGHPLSVLRSDGCAEPSVHAGAIDANARDLCVLRASVAQALAVGRSCICQWGKGRVLTVERVGGPLVTAQPASAEPQATHYDGAQGGPDAWRWGVGE